MELINHVKNNNYENVMRIINEGKIDINSQDENDGNTSLHISSTKGYYDITMLLLNDRNINITIKNNRNETPLDCFNNYCTKNNTDEECNKIFRLYYDLTNFTRFMYNENFDIYLYIFKEFFDRLDISANKNHNLRKFIYNIIEKYGLYKNIEEKDLYNEFILNIRLLFNKDYKNNINKWYDYFYIFDQIYINLIESDFFKDDPLTNNKNDIFFNFINLDGVKIYKSHFKENEKLTNMLNQSNNKKCNRLGEIIINLKNKLYNLLMYPYINEITFKIYNLGDILKMNDQKVIYFNNYFYMQIEENNYKNKLLMADFLFIFNILNPKDFDFIGNKQIREKIVKGLFDYEKYKESEYKNRNINYLFK